MRGARAGFGTLFAELLHMGLTSAMLLGRSALTASQVALEVTGNNFANAATPGYSRQVVSLAPLRDGYQSGHYIGRGVMVNGIFRQVDSALQSRLWSGISEENGAAVDAQVLSQLESTLNELTDNDLSSEFSRFFDSWSELANSPNRAGARALVVNQGRTLASSIRALRDDLGAIRTQIDTQLSSASVAANDLLQRIADVNTSIVQAESGTNVSNSLRDQRDQLVSELSQYLDITTIEQPSGVVDVLVGSTPIVLAGSNRGIELRRVTTDNGLQVSINVKSDGTALNVQAGTIGGLLAQRGTSVDSTIARLDEVAGQLIFQINKTHSQGYGSTALTSVRGTRNVLSTDINRSLNDPDNQTFSELPFAATTGGFLVTVRNKNTGAEQTVRINVDLDGLTNAGTPGFSDDTSVGSLATDIDALANLGATVNPDGTLSINADEGYEVRFAEDSSGVLAVLGVNTYFTGKNASDIGVRAELETDPGLLATGRYINGQPEDNGGARAIADLRDAPSSLLGGRSITGAWTEAAQAVGLTAAAAVNRAEATRLVRENLDAQRAAVSGVSVDEESINLLNFQRQYQGAARFISTVDQLTQELLSLI